MKCRLFRIFQWFEGGPKRVVADAVCELGPHASIGSEVCALERRFHNGALAGVPTVA